MSLDAEPALDFAPDCVVVSLAVPERVVAPETVSVVVPCVVTKVPVPATVPDALVAPELVTLEELALGCWIVVEVLVLGCWIVVERRMARCGRSPMPCRSRSTWVAEVE